MLKCKYVCTANNVIIIFSEVLQHSDFSHFRPISAGFVSIGVENKYQPSICCYGESISLKLKSREEDTILARKQILGLID